MMTVRLIFLLILLSIHFLYVRCDGMPTDDIITVSVAIPTSQIGVIIDKKLERINKRLDEYGSALLVLKDKVNTPQDILGFPGYDNKMTINDRLKSLDDKMYRLQIDVDNINTRISLDDSEQLEDTESEQLFQRLKAYIDYRLSPNPNNPSTISEETSKTGTAYDNSSPPNHSAPSALHRVHLGQRGSEKISDDGKGLEQKATGGLKSSSGRYTKKTSGMQDGSSINNREEFDGLNAFIDGFKNDYDNTQPSGDGVYTTEKESTHVYTVIPHGSQLKGNDIDRIANRVDAVETEISKLSNATSLIGHTVKNAVIDVSGKSEALNESLNHIRNIQRNLTSRLSRVDMRLFRLSKRVDDEGYQGSVDQSYHHVNKSLMHVLKVALENQNNVEIIQNDHARLKRDLSITNIFIRSLSNTLEFVDNKIHRVSLNCNHWVKYFNTTMNSRASFDERLKVLEVKNNRLDEMASFKRSFKSIAMDIDRIREEVIRHSSLFAASGLDESSGSLRVRVNKNSKRLDLLEIFRQIEDGGWGNYNFTYKSGSSGCHGKRYIKRTRYASAKYVGAILCSSRKYKLTLGNRVDGEFLDIGDEESMGEDHCEFAGVVYGSKDMGKIKTSVSVLLAAGRKGYLRRRWKEEPRVGWMSFITPSPDWYECGISIP